MSAFWLGAVLVATGVVGVATMVSAIGAASFVLTAGPVAYRLTIAVLLCVTLLSGVLMVIFGALGVLDEGTQVITLLTSALTVIGVVVGSYFGLQIRDDITRHTQATIEKANDVVKRASGVADTQKSNKVAGDTRQTTL